MTAFVVRKEELRLHYVFYWIVPPFAPQVLRHKLKNKRKKKIKEKKKKINTLAPMKSEVVWAA